MPLYSRGSYASIQPRLVECSSGSGMAQDQGPPHTALGVDAGSHGVETKTGEQGRIEEHERESTL